MNKRFFVVSGESGLTELQEADALLRRAASCIWIDVEGHPDDELSDWLTCLGFSPDSVQACSEIMGRSRVQISQAEVFFESSVIPRNADTERIPFAFLCRPDTCVTIHSRPVEGLSEGVDRFVRQSSAPAGTVSFLVAALLAVLSGRTVDVAGEVRDQIRQLQERLDQDPDRVELEEIQASSRAVRTLDGVVGERIVVLDRLRVLETPTLELSDIDAFRVVLSDTRYLDRTIDRLDKRVTDLRVNFGANQQDRMNRRLEVLTVISGVFLPLTLIAGIYGMNFAFMPELGFRFAYPMALGAMLVLALGLIVYFRSRGWFD